MSRLIAHICYLLQLHRVAYYLNRNRKRILTFHNVLDDDIFQQNAANGVSNSLSDFKKIISEVRKRFPFSLDIDDPTTVTITFDDGYYNQAEIAAPYLIEKNIPAYLFVSGDLIINTKESPLTPLTIDKLLHWISYVPDGEYQIIIDDKLNPLHIDDTNRNIIWTNVIWPIFIEDTHSKGHNLLNALDKAYSFDLILNRLSYKYKRQRLKGVTPEQLSELKKYGWEIGWHTHSHYPVTLLSQPEKELELTPISICDSKVFSFPYGGMKDSDESCVEIIKQNGFKSALSNINCGNHKYGKWYRSRMSLPANKALLHFELSGLKHLLKYRRLLPKI